MISGGRRSWTCLLQYFICAACQMASIWAELNLPSIARKLRMTWDCLITSTWRFGPKMCSTRPESRIHCANCSPACSTSPTDSELQSSLKREMWALTWLIPQRRMVRVVEQKYLKASWRPSRSSASGESEFSFNADQRKSAIARVGWCRSSQSFNLSIKTDET